MKKKIFSVLFALVLVVSFGLVPSASVGASPDWLGDWAKRVKLTIDNGDIDAALSDFPILLYISTASGRDDPQDDISFVFDELTSDDNRKKIAVTTDDGTTECYVEIEKWDNASEKAWLWVKVPTIASADDTDLYLYYDSSHADNDTYVGDPDSTPAENVWETNFKLVSHMRDDPDDQQIRDSTLNDNDGIKKGAGEPAVTATAMVAEAQEFDGADDSLTISTAGDINDIGADDYTVSFWIKVPGLPSGSKSGTDDVINKYDGRTYPFRIAYRKTGIVSLTIFHKGPPKRTSYVTSADIRDGDWYYITLMRDTSDDKIKAYTNDALSNETEDTVDTDLSNAEAIYMGNDVRPISVQDNHFAGIIDELRISDGIRTLAWIKATYESERDHLLDFGSEELSVIEVEIDIKPGSDPNSINLKSKGVVPVAVLADDFDVSTIDPGTVRFAVASPVRWTLEDVDSDNDIDMLFHFKTQELDLTTDSTEATLTGKTLGGIDIKGTDTVNIVPKGKGKK